jgi:hypothetical protein
MHGLGGGRQLKFFSRSVSSHRSFIVQPQAHFHLRGMNGAHFRGRDKGKRSQIEIYTFACSLVIELATRASNRSSCKSAENHWQHDTWLGHIIAPAGKQAVMVSHAGVVGIQNPHRRTVGSQLLTSLIIIFKLKG